MQAERMSSPITCPVQRKDALFYVLYGANRDYVARLIEESALNIAAEYPGVADALQALRPAERDPLDNMRIKFFVLLNEDETMRRNLSNVREAGQTGMVMVCSLCPFKAERFYDALSDELIPGWIKDCRVTREAFVDSLRQAYLVS